MSDTDAWVIDLREQQLRDLRAKLAAVTQRAEKAEAQLALADEYGQSQWHSGASGGEFEAGPYETFAEWLQSRA